MEELVEMAIKSTFKKLIIALLVFSLFFTPSASAAFTWDHPANNEILTSPSIYLNVSGNAQDCLFNYNNVKNQSISCNGLTMIRLPAVDGVYNLTVFETFPGSSSQTRQITLHIPSGLTVTTYTILFIGLSFILVFLFLYAFGRLISLDFDLLDLCLNIGIYIALLMFQAMNLQYLGSEFINDWVLWIINYAIYTNVFLPIIAFFLTITLGPLLRLKYPQIFARMPGGGGQMPNPSSLGSFAKGA